MKIKLTGILFAALLLLGACGSPKIETNMSESIPDFEFTTQD